jgi:LPS sulfotransferase NodH
MVRRCDWSSVKSNVKPAEEMTGTGTGQGGGATGDESNEPPPPHPNCLADHDLHVWDWALPPSRSYLVCSSARSGSTWLCEELSWRGLGDPLEYLNPAYVRFFAWLWGCANVAQYRLMLWRTRTTAEGFFGMKILGMHFFDLIEELFVPLVDGEPPSEPDERRRLYVEKILPGCSYVWLRRSDKVRQAVSWWVADKTEVWMQLAPVDRRALDLIEFDFDAIDLKRQMCEREDRQWARFFEQNGIEPFELVYEDLEKEPELLLASLASHLGGHPGIGRPRPERRIHVQRNAATEELVARYRAEHRRKTVLQETHD